MLHPKISNVSATRHILKVFDLRASKKLGQNFLIDESVVQKIVDAAEISKGENVLEIGPGIGTFKVVANLPYYITTQILLTLMEKKLPITKIVTMVQREVAERMIAAPNSKIYGAMSVAVQFRADVRIAFDVPPESFLPRPEVTSSVDIHEPKFQVDEKFFTRVVRAAFGQRRKTLINSLVGAGFQRDAVVAALDDAGIESTRRAETLSLEEFAKISNSSSLMRIASSASIKI